MTEVARELVVTCTECAASETAIVRPGQTTRVDLAHAPACTYGQAVKKGPTAEEGWRAKHAGKAPLVLVERARVDA